MVDHIEEEKKIVKSNLTNREDQYCSLAAALSQVSSPTDSWYFRIHFQFLYRAAERHSEEKKIKTTK